VNRLAFLIPFRSDEGRFYFLQGTGASTWFSREEILNYTKARIEFFFPSAAIFIGESPEGEFNRSAAINNAFSQVEDHDIIVINDGDTVWNPSTILNGVHSLTYDGKFVIPYDKYHIMDRPSSQALLELPPHTVIANSEFDYDIIAEANKHVYHAPPVSGLVMMRSDDFSDIEGFDEGFVGWGEEDVAFVIRASGKLGKPLRLREDIYHIWHPKSAEYSQPHYKENKRRLRKNYL